jgi:hypothetical protein
MARTLWLNPPYSYPHIEEWMGKIVTEVTAGRVREAIMVTNNATDTDWFKQGFSICDALCFTHGRIKFVDALPHRGEIERHGSKPLFVGRRRRRSRRRSPQGVLPAAPPTQAVGRNPRPSL